MSINCLYIFIYVLEQICNDITISQSNRHAQHTKQYAHKKHTAATGHPGAGGRFSYTDGIYIRMYDPMSDGNIFFKRLPVRLEGYMPVMIYNWIDSYSKAYYKYLKTALMKQMSASSSDSEPAPRKPYRPSPKYKPDAVVHKLTKPKMINDIKKTLKTIQNIQAPHSTDVLNVKDRPIVKVLEDGVSTSKATKTKQMKADRAVINNARKAARAAAEHQLPPAKPSAKQSIPTVLPAPLKRPR